MESKKYFPFCLFYKNKAIHLQQLLNINHEKILACIIFKD